MISFHYSNVTKICIDARQLFLVTFIMGALFLLILNSPNIINENQVLKSFGTEVLTNITQDQHDYTIDSMFIALLSNGDASVDYNLVIESGKPITNVTLFGQTVQNLTLMDYNGTNIQYATTERPDKIRVQGQSLSNIHVTYTTPDLVDKQNRNWTFSFYFNDKFLLKMPTEARIIDMQSQPFLTPTYEQNLWGFGPGEVQVKYVIGPLGTKEEALASIRLVDEAIQQSMTTYEGIVLNNITYLRDQSRSSLNQGKYLDTISYATRAYDLLQNTSEGYVLAQGTISQMEVDVQKKKSDGFETSKAEELLIKAKSLFSDGQYTNASILAKIASTQMNVQNETFPITITVTIISILLGMGVAIFFLIRKILNPSITTTINSDIVKTEQSQAHNLQKSSNTENTKNMSSMPVNIIYDPSPDEAEIKNYVNQVVEEVNNVRIHTLNEKDEGSEVFSSNPSVGKDHLVRQVAQMKLKRPYLREEDKELLDYLVDRSGSAFESEIRVKFVLPRTSLWRLIKRLEREELLEVSKVGGQNLIKLRLQEIF